MISLRYGDLSGAASEANKLANELGQYCDALSKKVQQKMYSVEGGMSSALNSADYYVNAKIKQLRTRENNAHGLSVKTQTLLDTAKRVDQDVERMITTNQKAFFKKNPNLKSSRFTLALTAFWCDMKKVPLLGWVIESWEQKFQALDQLYKALRYWYKCGGGEQLLTNVWDMVVKVGKAVLAVAALVLAIASGAALIVIIAFAILAVIAIVNARTNVYTSRQAIQAGSADPAMSKIYSERDTLAQVLREENFGDKTLNRLSNATATGIEALEVICTIVTIVNSISNIAKNYSSIKSSFRWITQNKNFADMKLSLSPGSRSFQNMAKTIGVKIFQNLSEVTRGGFNPFALFNGVKDWQWIKAFGDSIKIPFKVGSHIPMVSDAIDHYQKNKVFYNTSDQLEKLQGLKSFTINPQNVVLVQMKNIVPKFEFRYPYLNAQH